MAYMNQEKKKRLAPAVKAVMTRYGVKGSLSVRNHSTLVLNIKSGRLDFIGNLNANMQNYRAFGQSRIAPQAVDNVQINQYWYHEHFTGEVLAFLKELFAVLKGDEWYDRSDAMTDYFDTAYYIDVNVGSWGKPYQVNK